MKFLFLSLIFLNLSFLCSYSAQAAKYTKSGKKHPAKIQIENARLIKKEGLSDYVSMTLIAKDKKSLHEGQVYTLKKLEISTQEIIDGDYNEINEILFINFLIQEKNTRHQTTLRLIKAEPMEFEVIENTSSDLQLSPKTYYKTTTYPSTMQLLPPPRLTF